MPHPRRTLRPPVAPPPAELAALRAFVKSDETKPTTPTSAAEAWPAPTGEPASRSTADPMSGVARVNFNTRLVPEVDAALKRAALERKLNRQTPHTIQEIVDEALRPWLAQHGYLPTLQSVR